MITRLKDLFLKNRSTRQTIAKNVFWLSISQVGSRFIRAIIIIYAARVLGAGEYGIFSYVLGLAGFFTIFADLGVSPLLTREVASSPEKRSTHFTNALHLKIYLLLITAVLIIFVAPKLSNIEEAAALLPFVALLVLFDNLRDFIFAYFRGVEKMEVEALLTVIMNVVIAAAGFIMLYFYKTAAALLFSYIASVAVLSIAAFYFIKDLFREIIKNLDKKIFFQFFRDSWPMAFSGLFAIFMVNIDIVMLGWWRTPQEIGYYSASQRVVQILFTLPMIIASATFPAISRYIKQKEVNKTRLLNEKIMSILYLIAIPLTVGGIILSVPIINFLFGEAYSPASIPFQILIAALLIQFPGSILNSLILAHNQQKKLFKYVAIGSLANVIFNILLIPPFGIAGSAIATFISQTAYYIPVWIEIKKIGDFQTFRHLKKIAASAIVMGIFSYLLNMTGLNVIINILVSAGIYFYFLYLMEEENFMEILIMIPFLKRFIK